MGSSSTFPPTVDEIREEFDELLDWEERYEYLIDLGRELPELKAEYQASENLVHGCMSTVWLVIEATDDGRLEIFADSDSLIVKGLIVVVMAAFHRQTAKAIIAFDEEELFESLGLSQHLSANRRNGLYAMVKRVKQLAVEFESEA